MSYLTNRKIRLTAQPDDGYLNTQKFTQEVYDDGYSIKGKYSVPPVIIRLTVDYLTEFMLRDVKIEFFKVSLRSAMGVEIYGNYIKYFDRINGLDDNSIENACRLNAYSVAYRNEINPNQSAEDFKFDSNTIEGIRLMVKRNVAFLSRETPVIICGINFLSGYTSKDHSSVDHLSDYCLWDIKIFKDSITQKHTLEALVYYLIGLRSEHKKHFEKVERIGIYNPRLNTAYYIHVQDIPKKIMETVEHDVMGL